MRFNPRTYIRYDKAQTKFRLNANSFNPRTYIRYDGYYIDTFFDMDEFQSTYLYKVRPSLNTKKTLKLKFQSTYLYKVRLHYK